MDGPEPPLPGGGGGATDPLLPPQLRLRALTGTDQEPGVGGGDGTTHSPLEASQHAHNVADLNSALNILRWGSGWCSEEEDRGRGDRDSH